MKQFTKLIAKTPFTMKNPNAKGRAVSVNIGDIFVVTNPEHMQSDGIKIDRKNKALINSGYLLPLESVNNLFTVES